MEILPEIIELSNEMIDTLDEIGFFNENVFIERLPLKRNAQIKMQKKWEQEFEIHLTETEFEDVLKETLNESVSDTVSDLVTKGALNMSISNEGDIIYSANKDFNVDEI